MAKTINISIKELAKELGKTKLLDKHLHEVKGAVFDACFRSTNKFTKVSPVDTGLYANSWEVDENEEFVFLGNTAPYAYDIEYGSKPHNVDIKVLEQWAGRKLQVESNHKEAKRVARIAHYKIKTKGTDAHYILTNGINDILVPTVIKNLDKLSNGDEVMKDKSKKRNKHKDY